MKIVLSWIQGSWKWTQWKILQDIHKFRIFETGWIIRKKAKEDSDLWRTIKNTIEAWNLIWIDLIKEMIEDFVKNNNVENVIFDWIPRNMEQKKVFDEVMEWEDFKVVYLKLDKQEAINRLLWRKFCPKTWETFSHDMNFDPKTWNELITRADDTKEAIEKRIQVFFDETIPVIEEYRKEWKVIEINADQNIFWVVYEINNKLWL
jgi:adenylate kinase